VLEVGCSEGVFTEYLARRCRSVIASDISSIAAVRAIERCSKYPNVRFTQMDVGKEELSGRYDVVFAMDVLYYIKGRSRTTAAALKLVNVVGEGGLLVFTDCRMPKHLRCWPWSRILPMAADDWVNLFQQFANLQLIYKEEYPPTEIPNFRDKLVVLFRKSTS
jgi:trans-aconitate methyltransferase